MTPCTLKTITENNLISTLALMAMNKLRLFSLGFVAQLKPGPWEKLLESFKSIYFKMILLLFLPDLLILALF